MTLTILLWLIVGLVLIIRGGSYFVDSSIGIARALRVPRVIIGCTIVSVATTSPELIVSATASLQGNPGFAIGNAIGSVIGNIGFILALLVLIRPVKIVQGDFAVPSLVMIAMGFLMLGLTWDLTLARWSGPVLIALGAAYLLFDFTRHARTGLTEPTETDSDANAQDVSDAERSRHPDHRVGLLLLGLALVLVGSGFMVTDRNVLRQWLGLPDIAVGLALAAVGISLLELFTSSTSTTRSKPLWLHVEFFIIGVTMVVVGSRLLVSNGVAVAQWIGVPPMVIGLTLVAMGTSLPELVTAITSAVKGVSDLSVGNIVGANIMNLTLVTGTAALLSPRPLEMSRLSQLFNLPAMLLICITLVLFGRTHAMLKRWEGAALLFLYLAYLGGLFGLVRQ